MSSRSEEDRIGADRPGELTGLSGALPNGQVVIVASRYNASICDPLVDAAKQTLLEAGFVEESVVVVRVPGAWELVGVTRQVLEKQSVVGAVTLGAVIRGDTTHDEHINRAVSLGLMELGQQTGKPIGFGLLTCNNLQQAIDRSGGKAGNKGEESAAAVIELLRLAAKVDQRLAVS
ncbi:MAG: 6,7-dimethyl-8-ribityllumazine synthase [Planctomycetota bacterium]